MRYLYLTCIALFVLCIPQGVFAYEAKVAPDISISENYISDKNLYLASLHTWFNATYQKDIVSVSYDQTISGAIFGDVVLVGKKIDLSAESFDDVRVVGDTVFVSGVFNKDLIIIARHVVIDSRAIINGDTLIIAHTVDAGGQFLGETQITASQITVMGSISGPTTLTGSRIVFTPNSKVVSEVSYFSPQRALVESGAQIQKELNFNQVESITQNDVVKRLFFGFVSFWAIIKLIATLFVIFVLTHLFRVFVQRIIESVLNQKVHMLIAIGGASIIGIPLLTIILFGSLVLIPVSIIIGCIFLIMIILLPAMSAIIGASFYQKYILKKQKIAVDFNFSALILILMTFIGFVPYIGDVIIYILYLIAFGATTQYLYEQVRRKKINL